jgi:hypothetical protein
MALPDDAIYWDEDHLDHRHLIATINGLFGRADFTAFTGSVWIETQLVKHLVGGFRLPSYKDQKSRTAAKNLSMESTEERKQPRAQLDLPSEPKGKVIELQKANDEVCEGVTLYSYPCFGLYIFQSKILFLAVRCGSIGQNGNGGHAHNDQLSFEVNLKGHDFLVDGGSYLYTPLFRVRNEFRSTQAHNTVSWKGFEQNRWKEGLKGLFSMRDDGQAHIDTCQLQYLQGEHMGFGIKHARSFKLQGDDIVIEDMLGSDSFGELNLNLAYRVEIIQLKKIELEKFLLQIGCRTLSLKIFLEGFNRVETKRGFLSHGYGKRLINLRVRGYRSRHRTSVRIHMGLDGD